MGHWQEQSFGRRAAGSAAAPALTPCLLPPPPPRRMRSARPPSSYMFLLVNAALLGCLVAGSFLDVKARAACCRLPGGGV